MGDSAAHTFCVTEKEMKVFQSLSGDKSLIHTDADFARQNGYKDVIAYGGIMLSHLSQMLGMKLPGPKGTSASWQIDYRTPLYVGEKATIHLTVDHVSKAVGLVSAIFEIRTEDDRLIATGKTQSMLPPEEINDQ